MSKPARIPSLRNASLLTRTAVTVTALLGLFTLVVGGVSAAAIAGTKAVFPPEADGSAASEPEPSGSSAASAGVGTSTRASRPPSSAGTSAKSKAPASKRRSKGD